MGKDEEWLMQQARRMGTPPPARVLDAPELRLGLELFLQAFMELTSCRGLGYGAIGPIPWLALQTYCDVHDIQGEQREDVFYFVQRMDRDYMDWQRLKSEQANKKPAPGKKTRGGR